jgi:FADH2 O2-dependent halogenase
MIRESADVLILGSGFAGSLMALLLQRVGRSVVLVDRDVHPRFAIGESSTPLADLALRRLATDYDLLRLLPLTRYGDWKATYPEIVCGLKRGFSYFGHTPGGEFSTDAAHSQELLVAASSNDALSDTHWLRADVDAFFAAEAAREGVLVLDRTKLGPASREPWIWTGHRGDRPVEVRAQFVIDGTGPAGVVARHVGATCRTDGFQTRSRSVFAHVVGLRSWEGVLHELGVSTADHTFPCDKAAQHQVIDEGWMWQLGFDNGVTSVGFVLDDDGPTLEPAAEWEHLLSRYPSLQRQFAGTRIIAPEEGLRGTRRLQRCWNVAAGRDWALLPGAAGFIDPLHSTGIAHSLFGIGRLATILDQHWQRDSLDRELADYSRTVLAEIDLIDHLVGACYATRRDFRAFTAAVMLTFSAVTTCERRCLADEGPAYLAADDSELSHMLLSTSRALIGGAGRGRGQDAERLVRDAIAPWNRVGLFSPAVPNMYRHTAPASKTGAATSR